MGVVGGFGNVGGNRGMEGNWNNTVVKVCNNSGNPYRPATHASQSVAPRALEVPDAHASQAVMPVLAP